MIDVKKFVGDIFGFNSAIDSLLIEKNSLIQQNNSQLEMIEKLRVDVQAALDSGESNTAKLKELQAIFDKQEADHSLEYEITNKRPKTQISYSRFETDGQYSIDVRDFYQVLDNNTPIATGKSYDEIALNALKIVRGRITYNSDKSVYAKDEYWAYSYQTLGRGQGDCEDGAILLANILVKSGVPYWRVRLNAGNVNGGGHAYVTYCRETDNEFVVLDWCYWPNNLPVKDRPTHKDERNYMDSARNFYVWFSWDLKNIYAKEELPTAAKEMFR